MPAITVLEKSPWFVSGLRQAFPDNAQEIVYCSEPLQFMGLKNGNKNALAVIDLDSLPEAGIAVVAEITASKQNQHIIVLVNRAQKAIIWEVMQAGCLCYLEKPVSMRILSQLCERIDQAIVNASTRQYSSPIDLAAASISLSFHK